MGEWAFACEKEVRASGNPRTRFGSWTAQLDLAETVQRSLNWTLEPYEVGSGSKHDAKEHTLQGTL